MQNIKIFAKRKCKIIIKEIFVMAKQKETAKVKKTNNCLINFFKKPRVYLSFVVVVLVSFVSFYKMQQKNQQKEYQAGYAGMMVYSMVKGYGYVCKENGYELRNFPQKFQERYRDEIEKVDLALQKYGYNLQKFFELMDFEFMNNDKIVQQNLPQIITEDLNETRRQIILEVVQEKIGEEQAVWDDKFYDYLSLSRLCRDMDENSEDYFKAYDSSKLPVLKQLIKNF